MPPTALLKYSLPLTSSKHAFITAAKSKENQQLQSSVLHFLSLSARLTATVELPNFLAAPCGKTHSNIPFVTYNFLQPSTTKHVVSHQS
jgi:hypothetical protein